MQELGQLSGDSLSAKSSRVAEEQFSLVVQEEN